MYTMNNLPNINYFCEIMIKFRKLNCIICSLEIIYLQYY